MRLGKAASTVKEVEIDKLAAKKEKDNAEKKVINDYFAAL